MRINYSLIVGSVIILFPTLAVSQVTDTITIYHKYYSTTFSKSKYFPLVVKYWLTRSMLDCEHRYKCSNKFKQDPLIPEFTNLDKDYKNSGYDRDHQMDAYDCGCDSIAMAESSYYSNVAPQLPSLNRGIWKKLEEYTRKLAKEYDSVLMLCSSVTIGDRFIEKVAVPNYCWKIFYVKRHGIIEAYSFRNDVPLGRELQIFEVSVQRLPEEFSFSDFQRVCPGVSFATLKRALQDLKRKKKIVSLGKGRDARWKRLPAPKESFGPG